jgi:hypothetical protein
MVLLLAFRPFVALVRGHGEQVGPRRVLVGINHDPAMLIAGIHQAPTCPV